MHSSTILRRLGTAALLTCTLLGASAIDIASAAAGPTILHAAPGGGSHGRGGDHTGDHGSGGSTGRSGRDARAEGTGSGTGRSGFGPSGRIESGMKPDPNRERSGPAFEAHLPVTDESRRGEDKQPVGDGASDAATTESRDATCSARATHCDN